MPPITVPRESLAAACAALGLTRVTHLVIRFGVDEWPTVEAHILPDAALIRDLVEVLRRYELRPIDGEPSE